MNAHEVKLAADFEAASREQWLALVDKAIKGADFEKKLISKTEDGLRVEPIYVRGDALPASDGEMPGVAPFTRGTSASPKGLGWDIRQFHSGSDPDTVNRAILEDLAGGANSIALHIASPGSSGLSLTEDALSKSLNGVLLDYAGVALVAGENAAPAAKKLIALWNEKGISSEHRRGHFNIDPLGTLAAGGSLGTPIEENLASAAGLVKTAQDMSGVTAMLADGVHYHNSGATEAQELGAMLATLTAYLRALAEHGIAPSAALPKIAVALAVDADQFLGLAKLRAARRLVWRVGEACGVGQSARSLNITAVTSWRMMTKRDPWTNILRTTIATAGAVLGGADAIVVLPFTYALGQTDSFTRRVARNIQIVLQEESNLGRVVDPAGGSWYIERLTDSLAHKAWAVFQEIEAKGGMAVALRSGFVQDEIEKSAEARAKAVATGRIEVTGVSAFPLLGDDGVNVEPWSGGIPASSNPAVSVKRLKAERLGAPFEALRDKADAHQAKTGKTADVFLASIGAVIDHTLRSTWVKNYLAAGGLNALTSDGYKDAEDAAVAFKASGAATACICSSDALYAEHAEAAAKALKASGAKLVLMAGRPGDSEAALRAAGVDQFLVAGADAVATLAGLQVKLGIAG
ncbi:MAG: methylmalonyl-CoA mutase subunit beta [Hyphomicrobium sp.]|jgi:methylmalonyl-CoA mutase